jgi:hypothetical protein
VPLPLPPLTGQIFGQLTAVSEAPAAPGKNRSWVCLCTCGAEMTVLQASLRSGNTRSCGCLVRNRPSEPAHVRFWRFVVKDTDENACWAWTGATHDFGYGLLGSDSGKKGGSIRAHRLSWEMHRGPIPSGMFVLHRCDNPPCCNPAHLFIGDAEDNSKDMWTKSRGVAFPEKALASRLQKQKLQTHCKRGHLLAGDNLKKSKKGHRGCKICNRLTHHMRKLKKATAQCS